MTTRFLRLVPGTFFHSLYLGHRSRKQQKKEPGTNFGPAARRQAGAPGQPPG